MKSEGRSKKAKYLRMLAHGYKALKRKDKAGAHAAAAEALERSDKAEVPAKVRLREPELIRE